MDRLKTKCAARRAQSTRVINETTTLLQSDCNDRTTISKVIDKLVASRDELRKINAELEDVILVEKLETEYEFAAHYDDQTLETLTRLRCRLEDLSIAAAACLVVWMVQDEEATLGEGTMAAADPVSGAGKLALHVHCSFSRQRMRLAETTNNCPPVINTPNFVTPAIRPGVESCPRNVASEMYIAASLNFGCHKFGVSVLH
ncbi:hypothetical protein MTO96_043480 [Rhipicephalus appendiculatus]